MGCSTAPGEQLWVDKYTPRGFLDLLSDETINREVLRYAFYPHLRQILTPLNNPPPSLRSALQTFESALFLFRSWLPEQFLPLLVPPDFIARLIFP